MYGQLSLFLGRLRPECHSEIPGRIAQSVTCLTADRSVTSSIPAKSHTFVNDFYGQLIHLRRFVSNKGKYVHKLLVNRLFKLAQEKIVDR